MRQKNTRHKSPIITAFIAPVCIIVYLAALIFAAVRIYVSIDERRLIAEQEFFDIADLAHSAGVLGFMDEPFVQTMEDALSASQTLRGLIISGSNGEYAFERERGTAINWVNDSPRFKSRFDLSKEPLYMPLRIEGVRNANIQAVAGTLDYGLIVTILRQTLLAILAALVLAFFTLLVESLVAKKPAPSYPAYRAPTDKGAAWKTETKPGPVREPQTAPAPAPQEESMEPKGLFSPHGNIGWQEYTQERLAAELHRCASSEQDLVFIVMEFKGKLTDDFYNQFAENAVNFFTLRDLIFERGEQGISIIYPNIDLGMGFSKAEEFHNRLLSKYSNIFKTKTELCIGLSSRAGRLVDAGRITFEAEEALQRALADPVSYIVAFKSDPEKYRAFVRRGLETPEN